MRRSGRRAETYKTQSVHTISLTGTSILAPSTHTDITCPDHEKLDGCYSLQFNSLNDHRCFRQQQRAQMEEKELNRACDFQKKSTADNENRSILQHSQSSQLQNFSLSARIGKHSGVLPSSFRPRSAAAHLGCRSKKKDLSQTSYLKFHFSNVKFPERTQLMMQREIRRKEERRLRELRKRMDYSGDEKITLYPRLYRGSGIK